MTIWCLVPRTAISDIAKWRMESSKILPAGSFCQNNQLVHHYTENSEATYLHMDNVDCGSLQLTS